MVQYFYRVNHRVSGPVSASVLLGLFERGDIDPSFTEVRRDDTEEWHPATKFKKRKKSPDTAKAERPAPPNSKSVNLDSDDFAESLNDPEIYSVLNDDNSSSSRADNVATPPLPPKRFREPVRGPIPRPTDKETTSPIIVGIVFGVFGFFLGAGMMFSVFRLGLMDGNVTAAPIAQQVSGGEKSPAGQEPSESSKPTAPVHPAPSVAKIPSRSEGENPIPAKSTPDTKPKKSSAISDHEKILACINGFLKEQEQGSAGLSYWKDPSLASSLFAVRSWKILDFQVSPTSTVEAINVRIDSSNKGGSQITVVWKFYVSRVGDEWKISLMSGNN